MKIYFVYRSGYIPNSRHTRVFEANSVLDWFVQNWTVLAAPANTDEASDALQSLLGDHPYGLPISDYSDEPIPVEPPQNLKQLKEKLEEFAYGNQVLTSKSCVQVLTDDDKIDLAWYVFDEEYAQKHADRVSIWLHDELPLQASESPSPEPLKSKNVMPMGEQSGAVYWMSSVIDGGGHLEDNCLEGAYCIEGIRLPEMLSHLRSIDAFSAGSKAPQEMRRLQELCKHSPEHGAQQIFEAWAKENENPRQAPGLGESRVTCSDHLAEIIVFDGFNYDYLVIFDDLWLAAHPELGQSLSRFQHLENLNIEAHRGLEF